MKYEWIERAIKSGGIMTVSQNKNGITAKMDWLNLNETIKGSNKDNLNDALDSLNSFLEDDAANEIDL